MRKPMSKSKTPAGFKACAGCPNPMRCRMAGKCAKQAAPKGKK